ncbi:MAG TPA: protein kinase, partial [Anaerolineales bacterium]|nr:protein kinase [Anaerolineales bacterium]
MMENWVGKKLGKVQIESLIGRGGAAEVYVGTHTTLERRVAVKILRNLNDEGSDALERFEREARAVAKLRHPHIVQVHDFDTIDNHPYLVMEYIEGPSLSKYLKTLHQNRKRLPFPQVIRLVRLVASALQYAHNNGIIHRDVKPGNILLTSPSKRIEIGKPLPEDFEPILTDFGLVRLMNTHRQTTTGHIAGTPAYMSPEQSRGEAADGRTDVYSLGIVLYELLAGDVPFDGESTVSILLKQVTEPPPPIPGLSPLIQNVLDRALAKDIRNRFQTPMELVDALDAHVNAHEIAPTIQFDTPPVPQVSPHRNTKLPTKTDLPAKVERPAKPRAQLFRITVLAIIAVGLGIFFFINDAHSFASAAITPSAPPPSATYTLIPLTATSSQLPVPAGPIGILHFENGSALADQVSLTTQAMPAPPPGSQYEIWLIGADDRLSLGVFAPDDAGKGELTFSAPDGMNLIASHEALEITIE